MTQLDPPNGKIFEREKNSNQFLQDRPINGCETELNHLLELAHSIINQRPELAKYFATWQTKLQKLRQSPQLESLATELRLNQLAYELRQIWLQIAHRFSDKPMKSPTYPESIALPLSYPLRYDYERVVTPRRLEEKLDRQTRTIPEWEFSSLYFSCGMAAIHSLLQGMPLFFDKNAYPKIDRKQLRLDVFIGYYESDDLIWNAHQVNHYRLRYPEQDELYENLTKGKNQICFMEPMLCDYFQTTVDPQRLIHALKRRKADRPLILIIDSTLLAGVFVMEDIVAQIPPQQSILLIELRSALKLDQEGLEISNAGYVRIFRQYNNADFRSTERIKKRLAKTRKLFGNNLTLEQISLLDLPWFNDSDQVKNYAQSIFDNNRKLARALLPLKGKGLVYEVNHPCFSSATSLPNCAWSESPFVTVGFREHENNEPNHSYLNGALLYEIKKRKLNLHWGTSFGFRHHRFEIFQSSHKYPSGEYIGIIRMAMGRNTGPSLDACIDLFKELFSYDSFQALKKAYAHIEPIYKHMPYVDHYPCHRTYQWNAKELKQMLDGKWNQSQLSNLRITGLTYHAEQVKPGDCFIVTDPQRWGDKFPADYIPSVAQAIQNGAIAILSHTLPPPQYALQWKIPILVVEDTFMALQQIARANRLRHPAIFTSITGSVGKTSTKALLQYLLSQDTQGVGNTKDTKVLSNNPEEKNRTHLSLCLANINPDTQYAIFDLNLWKSRIKQLSRLIRPHIALMTDIQPSHIQAYGSMDTIIENKSEIFTHLQSNGAVVLNQDSPYFPRLKHIALDKGAERIVTYSEHPGADLYLENYQCFRNHSHITIYLEQQEYQFKIPGFGKYRIINALTALASLYAMGLKPETYLERLASYQASIVSPIQTIQIGGKTLFLMTDSKSRTPLSIQYLCESIASLKQQDSEINKVSLVLGDMGNLKQETESCHRQLGTKISQLELDNIWVYGKYARFYIGEKKAQEEAHKNTRKIQRINDIQDIRKQLMAQRSDYELVAVIYAARASELKPIDISNLSDLIGSGKGLFSSDKEADEYFRIERDSWD